MREAAVEFHPFGFPLGFARGFGKTGQALFAKCAKRMGHPAPGGGWIDAVSPGAPQTAVRN